jgi:FAD synthetase
MRVMVFGTFDDLHPGHEYVFQQALERSHIGDPDSDSGVWAVVARDANVVKIKGRAPLQTEAERMEAIAKKFPDVHIMLGSDGDFLQPVRDVQPDLIVLGYDQKFPPHVSEHDLGVPIERLESFHPEVHKSSLRRSSKKLISLLSDR